MVEEFEGLYFTAIEIKKKNKKIEHPNVFINIFGRSLKSTFRKYFFTPNNYFFEHLIIKFPQHF